MTALTNFLRAIDAYAVVGIFSIICAIVGALACVQQADQKSAERWAKGDSYGSR